MPIVLFSILLMIVSQNSIADDDSLDYEVVKPGQGITDPEYKPLSKSPQKTVLLEKYVFPNQKVALTGNIVFYAGVGMVAAGFYKGYSSTSKTTTREDGYRTETTSSTTITSNPLMITGSIFCAAGPLLSCISGSNVAKGLKYLNISAPVDYSAWSNYKSAWLFQLGSIGCLFGGALITGATNSPTPFILGVVGYAGCNVASLYQFGKSAYESYHYINSIEYLHKKNTLYISLSPTLNINGRVGAVLSFSRL